MKKARIIGYGILAVALALAFTACPTSVESEPELEPTTGSVIGRAVFTGSEDNSGIIITLEEMIGNRSVSVINANRGIGARSAGERSITALTQTDASGSFALSGIPPGTYILHALSRDSMEAAATSVIVEAGEEFDAGELVLMLVGSIYGQITVDGSNARAMGFIVSVAGTSFMAVTCEYGQFTISGVPAGEGHRLLVVRGDFTVFFEQPANVSGGGRTRMVSKNISSMSMDIRIGSNGNWWIGDRDLGVPAQGAQGYAPHIGSNGNWWIGNRDLEVPAQGPQGDTPHIGPNGNWWIGNRDLGTPARGAQGDTPHIGKNGNWWIGDWDLEVPAQGPQGKAPRIGPDGNWWIGKRNLGVLAQGAQGNTPHIGGNGNWWIDDEDTGVPAQGPAGASVIWMGEFATEPVILPEHADMLWAYFNTTTRNAYIWNGTGWDLLAERGETGSGGADGVSINWRGTFSAPPPNPELNWAFHNSTTRRSYIFGVNGWQVLAADGQHTGFVPVSGVVFEEDSLVMVLDQSEYLTAHVFPGNATIRDMLWTSNRPDIASVDMFTGRVTAHTLGSATITVRTVHNNKTATAVVTVKTYIPIPDVPTVAGEPSEFAGRLLVFQAGAAQAGAIGRNFVELYNTTNAPIDLDGFSLQYVNAAGAGWGRINLEGTIPAGGSFLVVGDVMHPPGNLQIDRYDMYVTGFRLSNRNFAVALMESRNRLTVANPFAMEGGKASGYVDMIGVINDTHDSIDAFETTVGWRISQQQSIRRTSLVDTDNNWDDFAAVDFRVVDVERYRPRYSGDEAWTPFPEVGVPDEPVHIGPYAGRLLILQAGAAGTEGAIGRSFVELFNNSDAPIDLGAFSLHVANGRSGNAAWVADYGQAGGPWVRINLNGTLHPRHSFLVVFNTVADPANQRFAFADDEADIAVLGSTFPRLSNRSFQIALMSNQNDLVAGTNPFTGGIEGAPVAGFVDLLGAVNTPSLSEYVSAFETASANVISQQASARRINLTDTNNNGADFERVDFRPWSAANPDRTTDERLSIVRPRGSSAGAWNPMTGESE